MFVEIADEDDPTVSSMEGISKLCEQLDLDPLEDIRVLVLLWKLGANEKPAQISKQEVSNDSYLGCSFVNANSVVLYGLLALYSGFKVARN